MVTTTATKIDDKYLKGNLNVPVVIANAPSIVPGLDFLTAGNAAHATGVLVAQKAPRVVKAIFNGPATVVFWDDGEKTVVKCRECDGPCSKDGGLEALLRWCGCNARFDKEKAVMAAMLKRLHRNYQDELREVLSND